MSSLLDKPRSSYTTARTHHRRNRLRFIEIEFADCETTTPAYGLKNLRSCNALALYPDFQKVTDDFLRQLVEPHGKVGAQTDIDMRVRRFEQHAFHRIREALSSFDPTNCASWNIKARRGMNERQCDFLRSHANCDRPLEHA